MSTRAFFVLIIAATAATRVLTQRTSATSSASISASGERVSVTNTTTAVSDGSTTVVTNEATTSLETEEKKEEPSSDAEEGSEDEASTPPSKPTSSPDASDVLDIYILADTTGGMGTALERIQNDVTTFVERLFGLVSVVKVGVGEYKDTDDPVVFGNILSLSSKKTAVTEAIESLSAVGGGKTLKEAQLYALEQVATDTDIGFDPMSTKILVWMGKQPGKDPILESTEESATNALVSGGIHVVAVDLGNLDKEGQATRITKATKGLVVNGNPKAEDTAMASVSDEGASATATGTGDSVQVSTQANEKSASATNNPPPPLTNIILNAIESLVQS